jgi:hypothetical protein
LKNEFVNPRTVSDPIQPRATAHGAWRPSTHSQPKGWLGLGLAARSDREVARQAARGTRDGAVAHSPVALWWLAGSKVLPVSLRGGHRKGAGQGGRGWSSSERRRGMEAVEDASGIHVRRRRGSSGGRWRWRHGLAMSARKEEGEGGLKWGQRWRMEGSHREAVEAVALGRKPERRRGSPVVEAGEADA